MASTIAAWAANFAVNALPAGASAAVSSAVYYTAYAATFVATTAAMSYAARALGPDTPSPDAAQGSMKQTIPPRIVAYGYGKLPAQLMLWEAKDNYAYDVGALNWGQSESIDEIWSHDHVLNIGLDGWVIPNPETYGNGFQQIHVETRLGLPTETAYPNIVAELGPMGVWTNNHRGDGIASLGVDFHHDKKENLLDDYPNGAPSWSAVGNWSLIWDPRDDSMTASRNTAVQILDLLTREDGFNESYDDTIAPVLDHWLAEMDICDEPVPLKAGGFVSRYESFVYRALSDDPQEALEKLLTACDGRLLMDENGCWKLWVGKYRAPTVFLTEEDIVGYDVAGDASAEDVVNELVPSFKSPDHKWNMVATDPWQASSDVEMRGKVQSSPMEVEAATNNSQVRRLAKREMSRLLSPLKGRLDCKLSADRACGERWVGIDFPELDLVDEVIEVEDGGQTAFSSLSVTIPFTLADPNADAWNAATEEGDGPQLTDRVVRDPLEAPVIVDVTPFLDSIGGSDGTRLNIEATGPEREDITWSARWRVTGSSSWVEGSYVDIDPGTPVVLETGFVAADALDVQVAYTTGGGSLSPWSDTETVDASIPTDPVDAALAALTGAMTAPPSATRKSLMRTMISALVSDGVWDRLDSLFILSAHDAQAGRVDWKAPARVAAVGGAPAFTTDRGYVFDGVDDYLDTGFNPVTSGGQLSATDAHIGVYERTNTASTSGFAAGALNGSNILAIVSRTATSTVSGRVASSVINAGGQTDSRGLTSLQRDGTTFVARHNAVDLSTTAPTTTNNALPNANVFLGAYSSAGTPAGFRACELAAAWTGRSLTSTQQVALRDALESYLDAIGAGVI